MMIMIVKKKKKKVSKKLEQKVKRSDNISSSRQNVQKLLLTDFRRKRENLHRSAVSVLTLSLPWRHFKTTIKSAKCETLEVFLFSFWYWHVKGFSSKRIALKADVLLQDRKIYCLQARPCLFQPGRFTGWGSEGINFSLHCAVPHTMPGDFRKQNRLEKCLCSNCLLTNLLYCNWFGQEIFSFTVTGSDRKSSPSLWLVWTGSPHQ